MTKRLPQPAAFRNAWVKPQTGGEMFRLYSEVRSYCDHNRSREGSKRQVSSGQVNDLLLMLWHHSLA
jgi:hypothetical protein